MPLAAGLALREQSLRDQRRMCVLLLDVAVVGDAEIRSIPDQVVDTLVGHGIALLRRPASELRPGHALRSSREQPLDNRCRHGVRNEPACSVANVAERNPARDVDAPLDRARRGCLETELRPLALVLGHAQQDVAHHPRVRVVPELLRRRVETAAARLDPLERVQSILQAPAEPAQIPDRQPPDLPSLDPLQTPIPERAAGIPAACIQLLDDLDNLEPFTLRQRLDRFALQLRAQEAVALPASDTRHAHIAEHWNHRCFGQRTAGTLASMAWLLRDNTEMVRPDDALPGRSEPMPAPDRHEVLGTPLTPPFPEQFERAIFGMGCFWGADRSF